MLLNLTNVKISNKDFNGGGGGGGGGGGSKQERIF